MKKMFKIFFCLLLGIALGVIIQEKDVKAAIPENISIWSDPKIIHISNDFYLKDYIFQAQIANTKSVTEVSKELYLKNYSTNINISNTSMEVEILGHIYPDEIANYLPDSLQKLIQQHTSIIDSGEKSVDSNRWIWDSIAVVIDYFNRSKSYNITSDETIIKAIYHDNPDTELNKNVIKSTIDGLKQRNNSDFIKQMIFFGQN